MTNMQPIRISKTKYVNRFGDTPVEVQIAHFSNGTKLPYVNGKLMESASANRVLASWMTNTMLVVISICHRKQVYLTLDNLTGN
jgi:hypothetical protein